MRSWMSQDVKVGILGRTGTTMNTCLIGASIRTGAVIIIVLYSLGCGGDGEETGCEFLSDAGSDSSQSERCLSTGTFPCLSSQEIAVKSGLLTWVEEIVATQTALEIADSGGVTECRRVMELKNAILCGAYDYKDINQMLARATIYIEGMVIGEKGKIIATDDEALKVGLESIAGHDLTGESLEEFYEAVAESCTTDQGTCLTDREQGFAAIVDEIAAQSTDFAVITFAAVAPYSPWYVVGHEILHAQYFFDKGYRSSVDEYWESLDETQRASIREELSHSYDADDEFLIINEFQAYTVHSSGMSLYYDFIKKHRQFLTRYLTESGHPPLQPQPN